MLVWYCVAKYCINFLLQYLNVYRFRNGCKTFPDGLIVSNCSECKSCILTLEQVNCTNVLLTLITSDTHNLLTSFLADTYKLYGISRGGHLPPWIMVMAAWTINMGPNSHENLQTRPLSKSIICTGMTCICWAGDLERDDAGAAPYCCCYHQLLCMVWIFHDNPPNSCTVALEVDIANKVTSQYIISYTLTTQKTLYSFWKMSRYQLRAYYQGPKSKRASITEDNSQCAVLMMVVVCSQSGYHHIHT